MQVILFSVNLKIVLIDECFFVFRASHDDLFMGLNQLCYDVSRRNSTVQ